MKKFYVRKSQKLQIWRICETYLRTCENHKNRPQNLENITQDIKTYEKLSDYRVNT